MASKQITSVRVGAGADGEWKAALLERVTWLEDGGMFPRDEPADKVVRAINGGEAFYVRTADGPVQVTTRLLHGKYTLTAVAPTAAPDAPAADALAALPRY